MSWILAFLVARVESVLDFVTQDSNWGALEGEGRQLA
jgi:hypothetical protein